MKAIFSLDIGSSSTKAGFYSLDTGERIPGEMFTHRHHGDPNLGGGRWTLDPAALETEIVQITLRALSANPALEIVGVAFCTFWHSFVGVDDDANAQTPISMWSDTRADAQADALRDEMDRDDYTQRTGCPVHTSYPPARLRWMSEEEPEILGRCVRLLSPGEYLYARLFGLEPVASSVSMASASGLYNQTTGAWDEEILSRLPGVSVGMLSPVSDAPISGLRPEYRRSLPRLADVPWFPALGDGACSNFGCGATTPERIALMIGTSGALRVALPRVATPPNVPSGLWRYQADSRRFLVGGALSNGGIVWDWLTKTVRTDATGVGVAGINADDETGGELLEAAVTAEKPDAHGLTVLPFLNGERAPLWQDGLTSTIHGLTVGTTPVEIARAYLEAVAYRFALLRERVAPLAPHAELIGTGAGLIASPVWSQILADALGETLIVVDEPQASSRGAALWAREQLGSGKIEDAELPPVVARYTPDAANTKIYQIARARQEALLTTMQAGDAG